jgi:hypothetical protein
MDELSRIIKETIEAGRIMPYDPESSKKYMKYVVIPANSNYPWISHKITALCR